MTTRADCVALDRDDPLAPLRAQFRLPTGVIYLDGNSLGPLTEPAARRIAAVTDEQWGRDLITSWNRHDWVGLPARAGARIARLVGAAPHQVIVTDSVSVNLYKLVAAVMAQSTRRKVLSEPGNFPTDLYVIGGALGSHGGQLSLVPRDRLVDAIDNDTALVVLTHSHYKSAELFDLPAVTRAAHAAGALVIWDLSHSVGVLDVGLDAAGADFAVGCGYKYLNGGPGAPGFVYVAERHHGRFRSPLTGWFGHARPFRFSDAYEPAPGITQFLCGTPPVLSLAALDAALELFDGVEMGALMRKARALGDLMIARVEQRCAAHGLALASPRDASLRGGHVSFRHPDGYAIMQVLIERGVIGDFREPDILRFGLAPTYVRHVDVWDAVETLGEVLDSGSWREPRYSVRAAVT